MRYRDELDPAQGLEGLDHGIESPTFGLFLQLGLDALHSLVLGGVGRPLRRASEDVPVPSSPSLRSGILAQQEP